MGISFGYVPKLGATREIDRKPKTQDCLDTQILKDLIFTTLKYLPNGV